jgi:cytochrome c peroxidase
MTIVGTAYSPWLFWDGRKDSQWAQALGPLENPVEHGGNRTQYAHLIATYYNPEYESIFGSLPDLSSLPTSAGPVADPQAKANWEAMTPEGRESVTRIYVNIGKAIAAFERKIMPGASRFDQYVEALLNNDKQTMETALTSDELAGLKLFIGKANCTTCHSGPLFTNNDFHNTGVPAAKDLPEDVGRAKGAKQVLADKFNCLSPYSDAAPQDCAELRFLKTDGHELERQFKVPTLRNIAETAPYMHTGQFATLREVLEHYSRAPEAPAGHSELEPRNFSDKELGQLEAFLRTLSAPVELP